MGFPLLLLSLLIGMHCGTHFEVAGHPDVVLEHYTPEHREVIDILPNDFAPITPTIQQPSPAEEIPTPTVQGQEPLGASIEQLVREPAVFGTPLAEVKYKMSTYLNKLESVVGRNTVVLQLDV